MSEFSHGTFVRVLRERRGTIPTELYDDLMVALEAALGHSVVAAPGEPKWLDAARKLIGTKEIPGPQHNNFIAKGWARLGAPWFNSDETPWCGYFVAHCMDAAGEPIPSGGMFARAKSWLKWGKPCPPVLGAVAVFDRGGGGHVAFLVGRGESEYYILGGNQSNAVSIMPIAKSRLLGTRWPSSQSLGDTPLPNMAGGVLSRDEQ